MNRDVTSGLAEQERIAEQAKQADADKGKKSKKDSSSDGNAEGNTQYKRGSRAKATT